MNKYIVSYTRELTAEVQAENIHTAGDLARKICAQEGLKLMAVYESGKKPEKEATGAVQVAEAKRAVPTVKAHTTYQPFMPWLA